MQAVPECAGSGYRLLQSVQAVVAGCFRVCRLFQSVQVAQEYAGSSCRLFKSVQTVPEIAGSGCSLFQSVQALVVGCSRVCRQWVQAVRECRLLQSV